MKHVIQKALHGRAEVLSKGRSVKIGLLVAGLAIGLAMLTPNAKAITQLEYLQVMVQMCGDGASFSASSAPADFIQWARNKGMNPAGGWNANAALTPAQLAEVLVSLYGLNPHKFGGDFFRILEREGITIDQSNATVTRAALARLLDNANFQSVSAVIARSSTTAHGNNGHIGDPPPPGWLNPRNPHFGQQGNNGNGNANGHNTPNGTPPGHRR
jgi:hypothetical protein